ncbi:DUF938 domain-containing protein [Thiomicrorhabdus sp. 6S3-12]|uniref:DUF938 domain-containing protein n=1 Tax=Thiomicrorhabdus sp. 6S3-12 TaxID=2819681 RepID=UPI001AAC8C49|nr:DUF938 domain-containing protein [Thiomicrorhabdus sp. 6S3-12]MBO1924401.1 DUF938 domain-containing protein [Thiomicrorhabdus sp. 6S3-12]
MNMPDPRQKPFAQSSEENKQVILQAIGKLLRDCHSVLEIASGTGQHAVYFAAQLPHLKWQTSDLMECHVGINQWLEEAGLQNVSAPICLNVSEELHWPDTTFDAVFSANSFHIMGRNHVEDFFKHLPKVLNPNAIVMIYGPFNYNGDYTSESNARFDQWLKERNPASGIKDFEWCNRLAEQSGLKLLKDIEMPQNNRILVWRN